MTVSAKSLAEALAVLRRRAGLTQRELGSLAGVHHVTISKLERGVSDAVGVRTLKKLARALAASGSGDATEIAEQLFEVAK